MLITFKHKNLILFSGAVQDVGVPKIGDRVIINDIEYVSTKVNLTRDEYSIDKMILEAIVIIDEPI